MAFQRLGPGVLRGFRDVRVYIGGLGGSGSMGLRRFCRGVGFGISSFGSPEGWLWSLELGPKGPWPWVVTCGFRRLLVYCARKAQPEHPPAKEDPHGARINTEHAYTYIYIYIQRETGKSPTADVCKELKKPQPPGPVCAERREGGEWQRPLEAPSLDQPTPLSSKTSKLQ